MGLNLLVRCYKNQRLLTLVMLEYLSKTVSSKNITEFVVG